MLKIPTHIVIEEYYKLQPKGYWFSLDTKRFFSSRFTDYGYRLVNDIYFISSEKNGYNHPRKYSIRIMDKNGEINNIGEFQEHNTLNNAKSKLAKILNCKIKDL